MRQRLARIHDYFKQVHGPTVTHAWEPARLSGLALGFERPIADLTGLVGLTKDQNIQRVLARESAAAAAAAAKDTEWNTGRNSVVDEGSDMRQDSLTNASAIA